MKFGVLALDYDGTISTANGIHPAVRDAIAALRDRRIAVLLVTGRIIQDLRTQVGDLRQFDAIVGENGAVLLFPESGRSQLLGPAPDPHFLAELTSAGIAITAGECVVEAEADAAGRILDIIRRLSLPLVIHFNRGRLMVLPQAVTKGTGLKEALAAMRLSPHNAVAIGDAENDHQMLEVVELGAAVSWGSPALIAAADDVVEGTGPPALVEYVKRLADQSRLPPERLGRRTLMLGHTADHAPLSLAVRGRNVLIAGEPRSGKSWVAGLLAEQLILQRYAVFVIDPEGDYQTLNRLPGVVLIDAADSQPHAGDIARALHHADMSLVLDLSHLAAGAKREFVKATLHRLREHRRESGLPHRIVVDEAHYFLHDPDVMELLDLELAGYTFVTHRASRLHAAVLASAAATVVTRETDPQEIRALADLLGEAPEAEWSTVFADLSLEEAVLLPGAEEAGGRLVRFRVAPRLTPHVRHRHKYLDMPVPTRQAFVFTHADVPTGARAHSLLEFVTIAARSPAVVEDHLRRGDVSVWIDRVFGDQELAALIRELEGDLRIVARPEVTAELTTMIRERYAVDQRT